MDITQSVRVVVTKGIIRFSCAHCESKLKGRVRPDMTSVVVRCPKCKKKNSLILVHRNQRKRFRKTVKIDGIVFYEKNDHARIEIKDVSIGGVCFEVKKGPKLFTGQKIRIKFTLPNKRQSEIDTEVEITYVHRSQYGAEFLSVYGTIAKSIGFAIQEL